VIPKKPGHVDSISVFLQGVKRKGQTQQDVMSVQQTPVTILDKLDQAFGSLGIEDLHAAVTEVSMTQLTRLVEQLAEAGLVAVDPASDKVELTDVGRSVAKFQHVMAASKT
jgi:DNA-binding HxlR family transcriptional regulator